MNSVLLILTISLTTLSVHAAQTICAEIFAESSSKRAEKDALDIEELLLKDSYGLDEFSAYKRQLNKADKDFLTKEDEVRIYENIKAKGPGWQRDRDRLILSNEIFSFGQVSKHFRKIKSNPLISEMDLIQAGLAGLVRAVKNFEPEKARFKTIAEYYIRAEVNNLFYSQSNTIKLSPDMISDINSFRNTKKSLESQLGEPSVTDQMVVQKLGWNQEKYELAMIHIYGTSSLDATLSHGEGSKETVLDHQPAGNANIAIDLVLTGQHSKNIEAAMHSLTGREKRVVQARFGLTESRMELPRKDLADEMGITPQRVDQILARALKKISYNLREIDREYSKY